MGTNSKTSHLAYSITPSITLHAAEPATDLPSAEAVETTEAADAEADQQLQPASAADTDPAASPASADTEGPPAAEPSPQEAAEVSAGGAEAGEMADQWAEAVLEVPQTPPEGLATGVGVLIGGEDLVDSTATLVSYASKKGPREALLATLEEDAEAKLLDAINNTGATVPVAVQQQIDGRLPLDEEHQLHELVAKAAKSVNHKLSAGVPIPDHTKEYWQKAVDAVEALDPQLNGAAGPLTADEQSMLDYYGAQLVKIGKRIDGHSSDKVPFVTPHEVHGNATITKQMPAPGQDGTVLSAELRNASRINAKIDPATGITSWNGKARSSADGKEYLIDLGDGYTAIYRPYGANDAAVHEYSIRGQLEVHAPQGAGHGHELVRRLGQLNLVNKPMTAGQAEWTYLRANIAAQGLGSDSGVTAAVGAAGHLQEMKLQEIFHARAHEAVGKDQAGLNRLARDIHLEASAACLPGKVALVRDAVAKASGFTSGADLAAHSGYQPAPRRSGGWLTWSRFDVTSKPGKLTDAFQGKHLIHRVGGGSMTNMFAAGAFASTERRAVMGVAKGIGDSEKQDKYSGGANSVFLRVQSNSALKANPGYGAALIWDNPHSLLSRSDYYGYNSDHYGAINPKNNNFNAKAKTTDPYKIAAFDSSSNEVMLRNGIDLFGAEAPDRIVCGSASERTNLLNLFASRGVTHLKGKPVTEIVQ